ncbi:MAG: asparagine synthase (glutamine-hydrolyzing) [Candidatus Eisenbacteria bacterium]|nr:asparagine synthase (glutamine-hydrolyzing) [Candidatus Eisenbacteria bacterium]
MCGIAGLYRRGPRPPSDAERAADRALVEAMLRAIEYRGPDDHGLESVGRVTFGVRRLAILDVEGGHQPLADAGGLIWAMQNGEIYNFPSLRRDLAARHPLRTHTDTELLPYLWLERGADCVKALRGMFALAVYDTRDETLLLARDALGVKPLYVAEADERILFASELKALLCDPALPREFDLDAVGRFLALGFVPGAATPFLAVRKLRPGCRMLVTPRGTRVERWWPWPRFFANEQARTVPLEAMADEVGRRLADSATAMLLSDRPLGVLLSGGVDSSVLAALLPEEVRRETRTFAIGFEGGGHHDERAFARRVAAHLGTRHREFAVPLDLAAELPRVVSFLDEPCADPAAVPAHLVARAAAAEVTVLISGTGGDETFGGYRRYRLGSLLRRARWIPRPLAAAGARLLAERDQHRRTLGGENLVMARKFLEARARGPFFDAYLSTLEPASPVRWAQALAVAAEPARVGAALWQELVGETGAAPAPEEAISFTADHLYYLPDDLLLKEDRTTMGASVEGRVPYLDADLVAFAAGLPLASRFADGEGKQVLRTLARRLLPEGIAGRRKHGFSVPIEDWLRGPLDALAGDVFAGAGSGVFRMGTLRRWHDEHRRRRDRSGLLWAALSFELWWRQVGAAPPGALAALGRPLESVRRAAPGMR